MQSRSFRVYGLLVLLATLMFAWINGPRDESLSPKSDSDSIAGARPHSGRMSEGPFAFLKEGERTLAERMDGRPASQVRAMLFSSDGDVLITGDDGGRIRFWDMSTGDCARVVQAGLKPIAALAMSANDETLASLGMDRAVQIRSLRSGETVAEWKRGVETAYVLALSPDGTVLATGHLMGDIKLWSAATGECLAVAQAHGDAVTALVFSGDGKRLYSGSSDQYVRAWRLDSGMEALHTEIVFERVSCLRLEEAANRLYVGCHGGRVIEAEADTLRSVASVLGTRASVLAIGRDAEGALNSLSSDGMRVRWRESAAGPLPEAKELTEPLVAAAWSPDNRRFATFGDNHSFCVFAADGAMMNVPLAAVPDPSPEENVDESYKIGYVDMDRLRSEHPLALNLDEEIEENLEGMLSDPHKYDALIEEFEEALKQKSYDEKSIKRSDLETRLEWLREERAQQVKNNDDARAEARRRKESELMQSILSEIAKYGQEHKYNVIMSTSRKPLWARDAETTEDLSNSINSTHVLYIDPGLDITDRFLKKP